MKKRILALIAVGIISASSLQAQSLTPTPFSWLAFTRHVAYHLRAGLLTLGIGTVLIKLAKYTIYKPKEVSIPLADYPFHFTHSNQYGQRLDKTKCTGITKRNRMRPDASKIF